MKRLSLLLFCLVMFFYSAPAEGTRILVTFGGDSTLGSEDYLWNDPESFIRMVKQHGKAYPFEKLQFLFAHDDLTVVNLENVFYESVRGQITKTYNFRAPLDYAEILTLGSIEAVTLGNNHTIDYGRGGFESTTNALDDEGVDWFVDCAYTNKTFIYEKDGIKIGFAGFYIGYFRSNIREVRASLQALQDAGCRTIVGVMHGGSEYAVRHDRSQELMADVFLEYGASVVIGHHPHVIQGMEVKQGATILYSLGNLSFGGNKRIKDMADTALVAQVVFAFDENRNFVGHEVTLHPIHPSGTFTDVNDFRPIAATGSQAQRVIDLVQADSLIPVLPYIQGAGARQAFVSAPPALPGAVDPMGIRIRIEPK